MKFWAQWYGVFRKELSILSRHRMLVINRLLVNPIVSSITVGILYSGFFKLNHGQQLANMTVSNFAPQIVLGLLAHAFLNNGYYFLPGKLLREWTEGTLPLIWINSCSPAVLLGGLVGVEFLCCLTLAVLGLLAVAWVKAFTPLGLLCELFCFFMLFFFGVFLGTIRAVLVLLNEGLAEILDHAYMMMIFLSCFYIPKELLPKLLGNACEWNPTYHAIHFMRAVWLGSAPQYGELAFFSGGFLILSLVLAAFWNLVSAKVLERSFG